MTIHTSLNKDGLNAGYVQTERFILNGIEVTDIARELSGQTSDYALLTAGSIKDLSAKIDEVVHQLDTSSAEYQDQTVMTLSLVDRYFNKPEQFILRNWIIDTNALYGLSTSDDNYVRIANACFTKPGQYNITINVISVPSGLVKVFFNDELLRSINEAGLYSFEITIDDITNDKFHIATDNLNPEERVIITSIAVYHITERFYNYLLGKIKSMATIDPSDYVSWTAFWEEMENYTGQFEASANTFLDQIKEHKEANNPHNITLEMLGGAPAEHVHEQYVTDDDFRNTLAREIAKCAPKEHDHDELYPRRQEIPDLVEETVGNRFNEIITIPPAIVVHAPVGRLPSRFMRTHISEPLTILLPSQLNPVINSNYSPVYGIVITNCKSIIEDASDAFLLGSDGTTLPTDYDYSDPLIFQLRFHTYRWVAGYKLYASTGKVTSWKVYSGNNTFMHQIDDLSDDDTYYFDSPIITNGLTFALLAADEVVDGFKIELIMRNQEPDTIYVCKEALTLSIPDKGSNRLVTRAALPDETKIRLPAIADNIPCFLMANYIGSNISFSTTWIRPEYGETRIGVEVFTNRFDNIAAKEDELFETYEHPTLGTLRMTEGHTLMNGHPLTAIYNKTYDSWYSTASTKRVVIEHEIAEDNVVLRGYLLNWREEDAHCIPDTWTLMVEGNDSNGEPVTIVVDSVENYFPCYSAEDDDIVFTKSVSLNMHVKKITFTMAAGVDNTDGLALNQLTLYFSKYYYSIPENTMYNGLDKTATLCLGYYKHMPYSGWVPTNFCLGKTVVVPLNDLDITEPGTEYSVPNPFLSVNITVNISVYKWMDSQTSVGSAQVTGITDTTITVTVLIPATYCLTITRRW